MMKQIRSLICWLALFSLASCSHDADRYDITPNTGDGVQFIIDFARQEGITTRATTDIAFNSTWEAGDEVGVFAVTRSGSTANASDVVKHLRLTRQNDNTWQRDAEVYYPAADGSLDFYAYYPYNGTYTCPDDVKGHTVATDQSAASGHNKSDLLLAKAINQSGGTVTLSFKHALAMVQVTVTRGNAIPAFQEGSGGFRVILEDAATSISSIDWNNLAATANAAGANNVTMYRITTNDGSYIYRAIVPAQVFAPQKTLMRFVQQLTGSEIDYSYIINTQHSIIAGQAGKYQINLGD